MFFLSEEKLLELDNLVEGKRATYFSRKNTQHKCMYPLCDQKAENSHAISREQNLSVISVNRNMHHFESRRNINATHGKQILLNTVGIREASAFKGLCKEHEKLFKKLDDSSHISMKEILLQSYRSICFSLFKGEFIRIANEYSNNFIVQNTDLFNLFKDEISQSKLPNEKFLAIFKALLIEQDEKQYIETERFQYYKDEVEKLLNSIVAIPLSSYKKQQTLCVDKCDIAILYRRVDFKIPVAALNHHLLGVKGNKTILLLTIVPYDQCTDIYWIFEKIHFPVFKREWERIEKKIDILNMIERSMMHCESWYISSNVIDSLSKRRLKFIEEDIYFNNERSPFDEYDLSIFDDLRMKLIERESIDVKRREMGKITEQVSRLSYEKRIERYKSSVKSIF